MNLAKIADWDTVMQLSDADVQPETAMKVKYNGLEITTLGQTLKAGEIKNRPFTINWKGMKMNKFYTLLLVDLDAPSRAAPSQREWRHFMLYNMKGNVMDSGIVQAPYIGSLPPAGSGFHRYVWPVYEQNGRLTVTERPLQLSFFGRGGFQSAKFRIQHNMKGPVAGTAYRCQWDSDVDKIGSQIPMQR
uniref:Phosphatidylethanolamine-binding protein 2 n=1 Tax=Callorhinchus milii TaxID=7868 RepID=K4GDR6_CALMI|nr:phosphatidylethanolamine-binding protein 2 [Callorhinchus milii]